MSRVNNSVAICGPVEESARIHLLRADGQEDLCFALWRPSQGKSRRTGLVQSIIFPMIGERIVHGNVSFLSSYFERALTEAAATGAGLALLHSHPKGRGWQDMSRDDIKAESGIAAAVYGATDLPLIGLTIAGIDNAWSARFWDRVGPSKYQRNDCGTVRVVGDQLSVTYCDLLAPVPKTTGSQVRTVSAWGESQQANLVRMRVGIVGGGSVGGFIAEGVARTGFEDIDVIDFDIIELKNLDRLLYAHAKDVGSSKVKVLAERLKNSATAKNFHVTKIEAAVYEEKGYRAALDCDVIFSCVDRPWGRHVLNAIAYAHLIPVVDGGIAVGRNSLGEISRADWKAHTATVGRRCLSCLGQYNLANVQLEREGMLDDSTYIQKLSIDSPLRASENVFAFSMACASLQMLQMLALVISPLGQPNPGSQLYHFVGGFMEAQKFEVCDHGCAFSEAISKGDHIGYAVTGQRPIRKWAIS